jgi:methionyl-tRNA formyltransferase
MRMDAGLDTGPMLLRESVPIAPAMTAGELHDALAPVGARLIVRALDELARGALHETPQPAEGVTYAKKIGKDEARLDWSLPALELERRVLGYNPVPVAWTELDGERVRIFHARAQDLAGSAQPGTVVSADGEGIRVATGSSALVITELQWPGGRALTAQQATAGRSLGGRRFA